MDHPSSADNQPSVHNNPGSMDLSVRYQPARRRVRFQWTPKLRDQFLEAANSLGGVEQASADDILKLMGNVNNLTKRIVASQLQKYRTLAQRRSRPRNLQENSTDTDEPLDCFQFKDFSYYNLDLFDTSYELKYPCPTSDPWSPDPWTPLV